jgi:hypothetical protein
MKKFTFLLTLALGALVFLAGCSTPEARIKRNPELFASISPAEQQLIREGKVGIGFTPEMVKLALGDPDRVFTRTDANGTNESWSYTTYEGDDGLILYRGFYHRYYGWGGFYPFYLDYPARRDREYIKVVFSGGRVASIEQQT